MIEKIINYYSFPQNSKKDFFDAEEKLKANNSLFEKLNLTIKQYFTRKLEITDVIEIINRLSNEYNYNLYMLNIQFVFHCLPVVYNEYQNRGLSDELFYDAFEDLVYKNEECLNCKECSGLMTINWYNAFLQLRRFKLGRFQYELKEYDGDTITLKNGYVIKKGATFINTHIPFNHIPLTDDVRMDSYKRAYDFFKVSLFSCESYLLYPRNKDFLPEHSNVLKFMDDFEIVKSVDTEFTDAWRIFGKYATLPCEELPEETSQQRAYKAELINGNQLGYGLGFFVHNE